MIPRKQLEAIAAAVQGVPVWGCLKDSPSAEAGVRYGDIATISVMRLNELRRLPSRFIPFRLIT